MIRRQCGARVAAADPTVTSVSNPSLSPAQQTIVAPLVTPAEFPPWSTARTFMRRVGSGATDYASGRKRGDNEKPARQRLALPMSCLQWRWRWQFIYTHPRILESPPHRAVCRASPLITYDKRCLINTYTETSTSRVRSGPDGPCVRK